MRYSPTLSESTADSLDHLITCLAELGVGRDEAWRQQAIWTHQAMHGQGVIPAGQTLRTAELEARWYQSLAEGRPDDGVYHTGAYVIESWACWRVYARRYLRSLTQPSAWPQPGELCLLDDLEPIETVVDLGCGLGYTTAVWQEWVGWAEVWGTNLPETVQWQIAEQVAEQVGFHLVEGPEQVDPLGTVAPVDVVFASEYFEHFEAPLVHLGVVLDALKPRALLIANAFGSRSCGHFEIYRVGGDWLDGPATSRAFHAHLRAQGYEKVQTKIWNNRPAYWRWRL